jgi:hypothetical protein
MTVQGFRYCTCHYCFPTMVILKLITDEYELEKFYSVFIDVQI